MITNTGRHERTSIATGALFWSALVLGVLGTTGCGGGGGSGSNASSTVRVNSIAPHSGPFIGGTAVTIRGVKFVTQDTDANTVKIGGRDCTDVVTVDDTTITCTTPSGTPGMTVDVVVTNLSGQGKLSAGWGYLSAPLARSDLNGDGIADLVVGAPLDDTIGMNAGAVLVFFGSDNPVDLVDRTTAQADLRVLGQKAGDSFGGSVCTGDVNGDGIDDLVVGANLADSASTADAGAAYVFYGPLTQASPISAQAANVKLTGEIVLAGDRFGSIVELGDMTGDGKIDLVVSATQHDSGDPTVNPNALDTGCVYVFEGGAVLASQGAEQADYKFGGLNRTDRLGNSLSCGDLNSDGIPDLVIASQFNDPYLPPLMQNAGSVYVMLGGMTMQSGMVSQANALFTGEEVNDQFGATVAVGDVNGDGQDDLIVGAPFNDYYEFDGGRVYVFLGGAGFTGKIAQQSDVKLSGVPTHNSFGKALGVADANGDNVCDLLIGAPNADYFNDGNGRSYLFLGGAALADSLAISADKIFNGENSLDDALGSAVSIVDMNGDHLADVVLSAARNGGGAGRVYVFLTGGPGGQMLATNADIKYSGTQNEILFGTCIAEGQ